MTPRHIIIGTAGHIDHGKSALVLALTGTDPDRLKEEKARGITIELGFAHWTADDFVFSFVDVPGHERFVKNMLAGVGGFDAVVLVVAADESVMPQTREHFEICRLLGVREGLVAVTKSDLADSDTVELVTMETRELVAGSFLAGAPILAVSARTGDGSGCPAPGPRGPCAPHAPPRGHGRCSAANRPRFLGQGLRHGRHGDAARRADARRRGTGPPAGRATRKGQGTAGARRRGRGSDGGAARRPTSAGSSSRRSAAATRC